MHFRQLLKLVHWFVPCHQKPLVAEKKLFRDPSNIQYAVMVQTSECGRSWDAKNAATGGGHGESHTGGCCHVAAMGIKTPRSWDMEPLQLWWNLSLYSWSCTSKYFQKDPMVYHCQAQGRRQPQMPQAVAETTLFETRCFRFGFLQRHGWHGDDIRTSLMLSTSPSKTWKTGTL